MKIVDFLLIAFHVKKIESGGKKGSVEFLETRHFFGPIPEQ